MGSQSSLLQKSKIFDDPCAGTGVVIQPSAELNSLTLEVRIEQPTHVAGAGCPPDADPYPRMFLERVLVDRRAVKAWVVRDTMLQGGTEGTCSDLP